MKCHYEILNLERNCDDNEIKTNYRKLALKWHPDKNRDDPCAKEQFQMIQSAYEVLSDSNERAWYDKHREQILRGGDKEYEDKSLDVFQYFTVSCYKGFGDDPKGFYSIYSEVFKTIATEDIEYMETEGEFESIPVFGNSESSYSEVVGPFYGWWQSYCTKKSYAWLCPHNINEIRDRRIMKVIEKENKKIQQNAKKERNEEVRNLVAFVRKRDKRIKAHKLFLEEKSEINRIKQEKIRLEQILKRQEEIKEQGKTQIKNDDYAKKLRQLEATYSGSSDDDDDEDEDDNIDNLLDNDKDENENDENNTVTESDLQQLDDLFCIACNKNFKTTNSFKNHQLSKRHYENIELLKMKMLEDEENYQNLLTTDESDVAEEEVEVVKPKSKQKNKKSKKKAIISIEYDDDEDNVGGDKIVAETINNSDSVEKDILTPIDENLNDDWHKNDIKRGGKKGKKQKKLTSKLPNEKKLLEEKAVSEDSIKMNGKKTIKSTKSKKNKKHNSDESEDEIDDESSDKINTTIDINHICVTCNQKFDSKNKLFIHLKKLGHGVYLGPKTGVVADYGDSSASASLPKKINKKNKQTKA